MGYHIACLDCVNRYHYKAGNKLYPIKKEFRKKGWTCCPDKGAFIVKTNDSPLTKEQRDMVDNYVLGIKNLCFSCWQYHNADLAVVHRVHITPISTISGQPVCDDCKQEKAIATVCICENE